MTNELKPCPLPWCDGVYPPEEHNGWGSSDSHVYCGWCEFGLEEKITVAKWNHRPLEQQLIEALEECYDYFDGRADADCDELGYIPNTEMRMSLLVQAALKKAGVECPTPENEPNKKDKP